MTDSLTLTRALEGSGMQSESAERIAMQLRADFATVRADMREMEHRLSRRIDTIVVRLGTLAVIIVGLLFAALHYWPPHPSP